MLQKKCPPESIPTLFTDREAPGGAASRARCSDKKQLFEQQLRHCSKFLQEKMVWAQHYCRKRWSGLKIGVRKLAGLLYRCKENERIVEKCRLLKITVNVEMMNSVETIVEVSNPFPCVVSGSRFGV